MSQGRTVFFDTNIFLRLLVPEDLDSLTECKQLIEFVGDNNISVVISPFIIAEIVWVLDHYYHQNKEQVCESVEAIQNLSGIRFSQNIQMDIALELFRTHNVKYIDATIASIPQILSGEISVISYDTDFGKLPVKWLKPNEFLEQTIN